MNFKKEQKQTNKKQKQKQKQKQNKNKKTKKSKKQIQTRPERFKEPLDYSGRLSYPCNYKLTALTT